MLSSKKLRQNKLRISLVVLVVVGIATYNYLYVNAIEVFIEANNKKEESFIIYTSTRYYAVTSYTTGGEKRVISSGSAKRLPIQIKDKIFFNRFYAWVYHPDYIRQHRNKANRTILWTVKFPRFIPISWRDKMASKEKIRMTYPDIGIKETTIYRRAAESGDIIRIGDVLAHLARFKKDYIPLFLTQGSKKQLREYLPGLKEIVSYTKANIEVNYDQLDEDDKNSLRSIDQELRDINAMLNG